MAEQSKHTTASSQSTALTKAQARAAERSQLDFEIEFFAGILKRYGEYVDVLRIQGNNLTLKGRYTDGLEIDKKLMHLRPHDPLVQYNLACSYALLNKTDLAITALCRSVELGYRDFRYLREDRDLDSIRHDPRFRQLLRQYENV